LTVGLQRHILPDMKRHARQFVLIPILALSAAFLTEIRAETKTIDLRSLAKKARPCIDL
jgi:7,8-dihydro-6-hydroxymethylpterin-pyrophosphokinase